MQEALDKANLSEIDLSAIAVTIGPGLSLCLRGNLVNINCVFSPVLLSLKYLLPMSYSWILSIVPYQEPGYIIVKRNYRVFLLCNHTHTAYV